MAKELELLAKEYTKKKIMVLREDIQKNLNGKRAETPGTTPMSLVASVDEALSMILSEGKEQCYERHELVAKAIRSGLTAMGLSLFPEQSNSKRFF